jgi:hypothetical protein
MNENNVEVLPPSSVMALERAQIDSQIATARAYPRSLEIFKKRATNMVTLDLETAESCIYSRPVGGGKVAEGESIRMAEIVAASYGNIRVAARVVEQTERYVKCEGVAHDLESNYAGKSECVESTVDKNGAPYSERQRALTAKVCLAKCYRDAVFKVVPKALCKSISMAARGVISKEVATLEQRQKRAKEWLKQIKVEDARVFALLGVKGWSEITDDHLITLTGLRTAINENDTTVADAFNQTSAKPEFNKEKSEAGKAEILPADEPPMRGATPLAEKTPDPKAPVETHTQFIGRIMTEAGVTFDDFRDAVKVSYPAQDTDSWASFDQIPTSASEVMHAAPKFLAKVIKTYGKKA